MAGWSVPALMEGAAGEPGTLPAVAPGGPSTWKARPLIVAVFAPVLVAFLAAVAVACSDTSSGAASGGADASGGSRAASLLGLAPDGSPIVVDDDPTADPELGGEGTAILLRGRPFHQEDRMLDTGGQRAFAAGAEVFQHPIVRTPPGGERQPFSPLPGTVTPPEATGPVFVLDTCMGCHVDGTEQEPVHSPGPGLVVRVADAARTGEPHPALGRQLATDAMDGHEPEGRVDIRWEELDGLFADGTPYRLRRPLGTVEADGVDESDRPAVSLRVAPPLLGLGLLESVPREDLVAAADPDDSDGDGISGRAARGRFGWKAAQPTVRSQTVTALSHDMGITTGESPDPCEDRPRNCDEVPGERPELFGEPFDDLLLYTEAIAVPRARGLDRPAARRGAETFEALGCAACHSPTQRTGSTRDGVAPHFAGREIHPYTDLLLHDMGPGLDDGVAEPGAASSEWRTAPLWGLGLRREVYGGGHYLHDGRARSVAEAILWHGGEAAKARDGFIRLDAAARRDLLRFLSSL